MRKALKRKGGEGERLTTTCPAGDSEAGLPIRWKTTDIGNIFTVALFKC